MNIRNEMMQAMIECGMDVESHRCDLTAVGRCCIDLRFQSLLKMADWLMMYKHIVKDVARRHNMLVTFTGTHPLTGAAPSMHTHFSLWKNTEPLFAGNQYAGLSEAAVYALGGILRHASAVMAFTNSSRNSYRRIASEKNRLRLTYGQQNRSVACRIPLYSANPRSKRIEFRCPDASGNPYLAFSAMLMAAIDGIQNKLSPPAPADNDAESLSSEVLNEMSAAPNSLAESLSDLERDSEFLLRNDVFTQDVIDNWIDLKRQQEVDAQRPGTLSTYCT
jgi:glutamine synthetase